MAIVRVFRKKDINIAIFRTFSTKTEETVFPTLGKKTRKLLAKGILPKVHLEVEKDSKVLISEVCGTNLLIEGGENIKIKPDSDYPNWLWSIHFGAPKKLSEMEPNSKEYWFKVRSIGKQQESYLKKFQKYKTLQK